MLAIAERAREIFDEKIDSLDMAQLSDFQTELKLRLSSYYMRDLVKKPVPAVAMIIISSSDDENDNDSGIGNGDSPANANVMSPGLAPMFPVTDVDERKINLATPLTFPPQSSTPNSMIGHESPYRVVPNYHMRFPTPPPPARIIHRFEKPYVATENVPHIGLIRPPIVDQVRHSRPPPTQEIRPPTNQEIPPSLTQIIPSPVYTSTNNTAGPSNIENSILIDLFAEETHEAIIKSPTSSAPSNDGPVKKQPPPRRKSLCIPKGEIAKDQESIASYILKKDVPVKLSIHAKPSTSNPQRKIISIESVNKTKHSPRPQQQTNKITESEENEKIEKFKKKFLTSKHKVARSAITEVKTIPSDSEKSSSPSTSLKNNQNLEGTDIPSPSCSSELEIAASSSTIPAKLTSSAISKVKSVKNVPSTSKMSSPSYSTCSTSELDDSASSSSIKAKKRGRPKGSKNKPKKKLKVVKVSKSYNNNNKVVKDIERIPKIRINIERVGSSLTFSNVTAKAVQANEQASQASDSIEQQMEMLFNEDDEPVSAIDNPGGTDEKAEIHQNSGVNNSDDSEDLLVEIEAKRRRGRPKKTARERTPSPGTPDNVAMMNIKEEMPENNISDQEYE